MPWCASWGRIGAGQPAEGIAGGLAAGRTGDGCGRAHPAGQCSLLSLVRHGARQLAGAQRARAGKKDFPELAVEVAHCLQRALPAQSIARCQGRPAAVVGPFSGQSQKPRFVVVSLMDLERFDYVRQQLEDSRRSAEEAEAVAHGGDIFSQVTQEVGMVVRSAAIRRVVDRAIKVSQTDSSVLLQGESGVGKSMLAAIVHRLSPRKNGPFVSINCGAIPEQLMESELFGYERGPSAAPIPRARQACWKRPTAVRSFFDEIGDLPLPMQVKLLEALDKHAFLRVGGDEACLRGCPHRSGHQQEPGRGCGAGQVPQGPFTGSTSSRS